MARILYGVAGEGSGHSSRAKEVANHLQRNGHTVKIVSFGKGFENLSPFFEVEKIFGLRFDYQDNRVRYIPTFFKNIFNTPEALKSIEKVSKIADDFKPDLIFSDYEPISGIVANLKRIPLISIDNQHRITNTEIEYPKRYKQDALLAEAVTRMMIANTKACLVTSFSKDPIINNKTFVFPPILRKEVLKLRAKKEKFILVYLTSEFKALPEILKLIRKKFVVYGFNQNKHEKNLIFKKPSQAEFLKDLASCEGIVANAGFTLVTEALYLGKPYLAIPLKNQFEQVLNAYYLDKLGYGKYWDELNKERIESFLFNLDLYSDRLKGYKKEDNSEIFKKIDELIKQYAK